MARMGLTAPTAPGEYRTLATEFLVSATPEPCEAIVDLHMELYSLEAVGRAMSAFAHLAHLELDQVAPYHRIRIRVRACGDVSPERLGAEFANYALAAANLTGEPPRGVLI
jgi:hypothetical protein